jgi:hypothetical protein
MTTAVKAPVLFPNSTGRKTGLEDRELPTTTGNFARLMDQAVRAPGAEHRKAEGQTPADAVSSGAEEDSEPAEISNEPAPAEDQNAVTGPPLAWLAGLPATVLGQPIAVNPQPAPAEAQDSSALPEHSGLAAGTPILAHAEKNGALAERLNRSDVPVSQPGDSPVEVSEAGTASAPAAIPSDSRPAAAGSSRGLAVAELTAHEQALMAAVSDSGTPAAQHTGTMQATCEMNENAGLAEQNLPCLPAAIEAAGPAGRERKARTNDGDRLAGLPSGAAETALALADQPSRRDLGAYAEAAAPPAAGAEGVRRAIENAALGLRRMDASSLSLVLTPDNNTQLALHVELHQGRLEVRAVLERGDFAALGAEWSQLQNRLAEQGVRLSPLAAGAGAGNAFAGDSSFSRQRGREEMPFRELPIPALAEAETRKSGARTAVASTGRAWWA